MGHDVTRSTLHTYSWFAFRVFPSRLVTVLSRSSRAVAYTFVACPEPVTALPWSFTPFDDIQFRKRPTPGLPPPGCAAPSGFLNLSTLSSARTCLALFHASATKVCSFRGFPFAIASNALRRPLPLLLFSGKSLDLSSQLQGFVHSRSPCHLARCYPEARD